VTERRTWPDDWADRVAGKGCPLCARVANSAHTVVFDGDFTATFLQRRTVLPGYCEVVWKRGHVAEPSDLAPNDAAGYWREVVAVGRAIQRLFNPAKMNYLTLGNWVPHLHTHVVPRYADDPAPGGPIPWDAMFAQPVPDDELARWAAELRAALEATGNH
jgi:diadenosine tetraphosphate (Ap4A) HIT family hydrolase